MNMNIYIYVYICVYIYMYRKGTELYAETHTHIYTKKTAISDTLTRPWNILWFSCLWNAMEHGPFVTIYR